MPDRSYTTKKKLDGIYQITEFGEVTVTNADTFTLGNFNTTMDLWNVYLMKKSDGTEMTHQAVAGLNNVVTITGAGTNIPCLYMVIGVKA